MTLPMMCMIVRSFRRMDKSGKGTFRKSFMRSVIAEVEPSITPDEVDDILKDFGTSGDPDAEIQYAKFLRAVFGPAESLQDRPVEHWTDEEVKAVLYIFRAYGRDRQGLIDESELPALCEVLGAGSRVAEAQALARNGRVGVKTLFTWFANCDEKRAASLFARHGQLFDLLSTRPLRQWTEGEVKAVLQVFDEFDRDGSRAIDSSELKTLCDVLCIDAEKAKDAASLARDGKLRQQEFFAWYVGCPERLAGVVLARHGGLFEKLQGKPVSEWREDESKAVMDVFKAFDWDESHSLDAQELQAVCEMVWGAGHSTKDVGADELLAGCGGKVPLQKFFVWFTGCSDEEAQAVFGLVQGR